VITTERLTKTYGDRHAVTDLSFTVEPGRVTGFLGPNGAGKSTTMRLVLGLDRPTAGRATINGRPLAEHDRPLEQVGALLEARAIHPGRTARNHLRAIAATAGIGDRRVDEVIDLAGLVSVANKRVGTFSLGMGQRLGVASALLADPQALILDEPVNGLDPDGIRWIRALLRGLADEGRTVFLSSHLMSEMAVTADHIIVIGRGRLLRDMSMRDLIAESARHTVRVRTPDVERFAEALERQGITVRRGDGQTLHVNDVSTDVVGRAAAEAAVVLLELTQLEASLEEAYMALTEDELEFHTQREETASAVGPGGAL
jgi:ABC-2 type transport system ATP-binding protein